MVLTELWNIVRRDLNTVFVNNGNFPVSKLLVIDRGYICGSILMRGNGEEAMFFCYNCMRKYLMHN